MDEDLETDVVETGRRRRSHQAHHKRLQNQWTLPDSVPGEDAPEATPNRPPRRRKKAPPPDTAENRPKTAGAWEDGEGKASDDKPRRRRKRKGEKSADKEPFSSVARCKNMDIRITLMDEGIVWTTFEPPNGRKPEQYTLPYERVLRAELGDTEGMFVLKYVDIAGRLLRPKTMEVLVGEVATAKRWVKYTSKIVESLFKRPKKVRVYLHTNAGRGNAASMFKLQGLPKLRDIGVESDIVEMGTAAQFIADVEEIEDLRDYDGLAVVGNQQSFRFLLNAVMLRVHSEQHIDLKPGSTPLPCPVPLALLPVGKRADLATTMNVTTDFTTATMNFLMGTRTMVDVVAVFKKSQCLGWAFNCQYGFGANAMSLLPDDKPNSDKRAETYLSKMLGKDKLISYDCDVHYIPSKFEDVSYPTDDKVCQAGCDICAEESNRRRRDSVVCDQVVELDPLGDSHHSGSVIELKEESNWRSVKGNFLWIGLYSIPCRNELMSPHGLSPFAHISDGCADLVLVRECKRKEFLRFLKRHGSAAKSPLEFSFVETHRVSAVKFQARQNITWEHRDVNKTEIDYQMNNGDGSGSISASSGDLSESEIRNLKRKNTKTEVEVIIDDCTDDDEEEEINYPVRTAQSMNTLDFSSTESSEDEGCEYPTPPKSHIGSSNSTPKRERKGKNDDEDEDGKKSKKKGLRRLSLFSFKTTEANDGENKTYVRPRIPPSERERERRKAKERGKEEKRRKKAEERLKSCWILDYESCADTELEFTVHSHVVSVFGTNPPEDARMEDSRLSWLPLF